MAEVDKRILIIEDEQLIAEAYADHLSREGYKVEIAFDGEDGLRRAKEHKPDAIILDILMPKMSGHEVLEKLKRDKETHYIPVIVLTNIDERQSVVKTLEQVPTYYMVKSNTSLTHLTNQIRAIFETKEARRE